jgi:hypothetical protein
MSGNQFVRLPQLRTGRLRPSNTPLRREGGQCKALSPLVPLVPFANARRPARPPTKQLGGLGGLGGLDSQPAAPIVSLLSAQRDPPPDKSRAISVPSPERRSPQFPEPRPAVAGQNSRLKSAQTCFDSRPKLAARRPTRNP